MKKEIEILKHTDNQIQVVRIGELIFGIGDVVEAYSIGSLHEITTFEKNSEGQICFKYLLKGDSECVAQNFKNHLSGITNIISIVTQTKENKNVAVGWWLIENNRRLKLPSFKVIADYPFSKDTVGSIVKAYNQDFEIIPDLVNHYSKFPNIYNRINHD